MVMKAIQIILAAAIMAACTAKSNQQEQSKTFYKPNWESLSKHDPAPEWFKNAKFGIYFHWGVYSVPAFSSEWYPRNMHFKGGSVYKHHVKTYGLPSEFGYHDFVPMFKAEHFDADAWAGLFKQTGARFAGPVAEHHDGFSMWDSDVTPWNVGDMGPKRDILGELAVAIRKRDMKLITTFHHARNLQRYWDKPGEKKFQNSHYPLFKGMPPYMNIASQRLLYGNVPEEEWLEKVWLGKLKEVIDKYQPDIIWFDSWLDQIPEERRQEFAAYYLNDALKRNKDVVIVRKQDDLPSNFTVNDLEKSRMNRMSDQVWMSDETISMGSWCYTENLKIKEAKDVLHVLIDIVSKNGVLLLNVSPKADGTIPKDQREVLLQIGDWLKKYGEAIYDTRPWQTYGEGPTMEPEGDFKNHSKFQKIKYTSKDIRFTTKGDVLYAILLGRPEGNEVLLQSLAGKNLQIRNITIPGSDEKIAWEITDAGLVLKLPESEMDDMAVVFRMETAGSLN